MPGHLRPYVLLFFISYINLFVYLFPIDVKCENLLLSFGSTYLFRIIHKSFSIYHCKGWGSGYIACFTSRLLIYKKPYRELQVKSRKLYLICLFLAFAVVVVLTLGSSIFIIFYLFIYFLNFQVVCASVNYFLGFYHFIHVGFIWANGRKRVFPFNSS